MKTITTLPPSTQKVRRDVVGGKRGDGHERDRRIHRPDPGRIVEGAPDPRLTARGGLVAFGTFLRRADVDRELRDISFRLKSGPLVVYPMEAQLRLLIDANVAGEGRVFGLESLAADPLFVHLAGGVVPSIDTVYRDLCRFDARALCDLEMLVGRQALALPGLRRHDAVHLDVDTTVEPTFGEQQEGALPGPNPRFHGRPSYHPIGGYVGEIDAFVGVRLRPGNTSFGNDDVPYVRALIARVREELRREQRLYVRMDAAGDCTDLLAAIVEEKALFVIKPHLTKDLLAAIRAVPDAHWTTVDADAEGRPTRQVAEVHFARGTWRERGIFPRVIAVRIRDDQDSSGRQLYLWPDLDWTVKAYLSNDITAELDDIARRYEGRAGIEPRLGELKNGFGIGKIPTGRFDANHAMLLLKVLAYNLLRRFVEAVAPALRSWHVSWLRRALICVPARLVRSARRWALRLPPDSWLLHLRC